MCRRFWNGWGSEMVTDIVLDPLLPLLVLGVLAGLSALVLALALWRGLPGWWLRGLAALVLLAALANPALRQEERDPLADIVLLVVDRSASQSIAGRPEQTEAALARVRARLEALDGVEIREVELRDAPEGSDAGTLLMTALAEAASEVARSRIMGAIVISDGQVHDLALTPDLPAPVQVLLTGKPDDWDRRLAITDAPAFAILG